MMVFKVLKLENQVDEEEISEENGADGSTDIVMEKEDIGEDDIRLYCKLYPACKVHDMHCMCNNFFLVLPCISFTFLP